ncbi:MAG: MT-A70 family methyltransferase, partial [Terriglobia bacterium]|nr:MT-A70 family methyltransferase [Terriglobia bacterium]
MRYRTIVADPPWSYPEGWPAASTSPLSAFNRGTVPDDTRIRAALPYGSMTVEDIAALPVSGLAEDDAHLLLWTTNRYVVDAYDVARAWGFRASQLLTWGKSRRGLGPGGVFANTSEFILYARRGKPEHMQRQDSTWWEWPRAAHSVKPDAMLDMVECAFPGP